VLGAGEPLGVGSGAASVDVWWGAYAPPEAAALADYVPPEEILVAVGRPGHGLDGFRRSHAEALEAARVAALAGGAAAAVTRYERVELLSLLASDFPRARAFVAARLGPLAAASEPAARLRETVLAFLAANGSGTRAAKELYVHHNTVAYRVKRAEAARPRRERRAGRADVRTDARRRPRPGRADRWRGRRACGHATSPGLSSVPSAHFPVAGWLIARRLGCPTRREHGPDHRKLPAGRPGDGSSRPRIVIASRRSRATGPSTASVPRRSPR
jgi:hypothetical protein